MINTNVSVHMDSCEHDINIVVADLINTNNSGQFWPRIKLGYQVDIYATHKQLLNLKEKLDAYLINHNLIDNEEHKICHRENCCVCELMGEEEVQPIADVESHS